MTEKINKSSEFANQLLSLVTKFFGETDTQKESPPVEQINKSVDTEQRIALFVVLEPQDGDQTLDVHGDTYTAQEIEKACHSFGNHCMKANLFHLVETEDAQIVENYISPVEFELDGEIIKQGTWLQKWYFPETEVGEEIWQAVKDGTIDSVSVQCRGIREEIND